METTKSLTVGTTFLATASKEAVLILQSKKLRECSEKELLQVIVRCGVLAATSKPEQSELLVLKDYLLRKMSGYGLEEFSHAFELYAEKKLNFEPRNKYQLGVELFSGVMKSYSEQLRGKAHKEIAAAQDSEPEVEKMSNEEAYNGIIEHVKKYGKLPKYHLYNEAFEWAYANGLLEYDKKTEKKEVMDKLKLEASKKGTSAKRQNAYDDIRSIKRRDFLKMCQVHVIKKHFKAMIE